MAKIKGFQSVPVLLKTGPSTKSYASYRPTKFPKQISCQIHGGFEKNDDNLERKLQNYVNAESDSMSK